MADLNKTVAIVFDATDLTSDSLAKIQTGLQGMVKDTDATSASAAKAGQEIQKMGDGGKTSVLDLANSMKLLAGSFVVKEFLDANIEAEKLERTFVALTGSTEGAAKELEYIRGVADALGVNANDLAAAWGKFSAATAGSSLAGEDAREIFEAFAGTLATLGASTEDISGAMTQLSQGVSKGKFELEDLKSIAERVPGFFNLMAESLGVTTEELFKMVSQGEITGATMVAVAEQLKEKYGDVDYVDTFAASWERLKNSLDQAYVSLGQSGVLEAAEKGVETLTLAVVGAWSTFELLGKTIANIAYLLTTWDYTGFKENQQFIEDDFVKSVENARNAFLGLDDQVKATGETGAQAGAKIDEGLKQGALSAEDLKKAAKDVDESLKKLGIDPKTVAEPFEVAADQIQAVIADLVNNPATKPEEMFTGMIVAIDKIANAELPALQAAAQGAFEDGKLSGEQYDIVLDAILSKSQGLWPEINKVSDSVSKQSQALQKTQSDAQKYALELEKIASNEKIKAIEAKVQLDIAEVQANAQIATAILDSLSQTYTADVGLIGDLMGQITNGYSLADKTRLALVDDANERANELHQAQMALIQAQVDYMYAKTAAMAGGSPLVTIQADGLQPHLEAFMWEILKQIQIKMAYDGGDLLTGGCSL